MIIENTDFEAKCPWPDNCYVQGGLNGIAVSPEPLPDGKFSRPVPAFVEAFPEGTLIRFFRGEGDTLEEAELVCWRQYQVSVAAQAAIERDRAILNRLKDIE